MAVVVTLLYRDCAFEWVNMLIVARHVGTHGSYVRSNNHVCVRSIPFGWTHEACVSTSPSKGTIGKKRGKCGEISDFFRIFVAVSVQQPQKIRT